jgi:hypothetical protein
MSAMEVRPRKLLRCLQCKYAWFERQGPIKHGPPVQCPSCHSERWHKRGPYDPRAPKRKRKEAPRPERFGWGRGDITITSPGEEEDSNGGTV